LRTALKIADLFSLEEVEPKDNPPKLREVVDWKAEHSESEEATRRLSIT